MNEALKIINELSSELKLNYPDYYGLYFFGSRSRGNYREDSDYDVVLAFNRVIDWKFKDKIFDIICDFNIKYDIILDAHIYNKTDIMNPITIFRENVKKEGIFIAG
jgi:predicted nucleotidyltransferase